MTKNQAIQIRTALKGGKNLPLRIFIMDGYITIDEALPYNATKWDDNNGILYTWRLLNLEEVNAPGSKDCISCIGVPYDYIGFMQLSVLPLSEMDNVFTSMEGEGVTFKAGWKEQVKTIFKEALHKDRWRLEHSDTNAIHGFPVLNTRDEYYTGPKFGESFKETRDKAEYNAYVQRRLDAGEDPNEPESKNNP